MPPRDDDPERMTRGARRAFVILALVVLVVGVASTAASVIYANSTAHRQDVIIGKLRAQQLAACSFARDLGSAPLPSSPKPSKLGVSIVADSRAQWRDLGCPGTLPPPSAGLAHWAAVYHLDGR